jgi:hypothetical protein
MTIDWHKIFSRSYLIDIDPSVLHRSDKALLIAGAVLVMLGIIFRLTSIMSPHMHAKNLWRRLSAWGLTIGLLEVLWFGFRYQNAQYLGSHLLAFIVLLIGLIWLTKILKYWARQYGRDVAQWQKDQVKQKYLAR